MASAWIPIDEVVRRVLEDVPGEEFSDESEEELSVHEDSESEDQGSGDNQDFSDSGDSDVDNHGNGMFFVCLHGLATVYIPMFSYSKFLRSQKRCLQLCSVFLTHS